MTPADAIIRFARLERHNKSLLIEAALTLALARSWLIIAPFRSVARRLGTPSAIRSDESASLDAARARTARAVGWAIRRAAGSMPFRAVCLQQAVAAKLMLAKRGIPATVRFGMAPIAFPGEEPRAHAWVSAGFVEVSGYPLDADLVPIAQFD